MTEFLAEQMRSLARRLEQLNEAPLAAATPTHDEAHDMQHEPHLKGTINAKKLAQLLDGTELPGVEDVNKFAQAINMVRQGNVEHLNRMHMKELAMAFIALLQADKKVTQQVMNVLRSVSADKD